MLPNPRDSQPLITENADTKPCCQKLDSSHCHQNREEGIDKK